MLIFSIAITCIYLLLLIWFSNNLFYHNKRNVLKPNNILPSVSIIVSARNEEKNIAELLDRLNAQNYSKDKYEIIIANDRSTDKTEKIIKEYKDSFSNIKSIFIDKTPLGWSGKKWALTKAISISSGEIILQTDADCLPSSEWVQSMVNYFQNPNMGFVCGASPLIHADSILNKIFTMESMIQESVNAGGINSGLILSCTGRNIAFRKDFFNQINGYSGHHMILSGDDDLLLQKFALQTNCLISYAIDKNSLVESFAPIGFSDFLKQRLRFASKGLLYFKIKTTIEFKSIIILLYLVNVLFIFNLFSTLYSINLFFIIPIFMKMAADFLLSYVFMVKVKMPWSFLAYFILTLLHPFYIIIIGSFGPFFKLSWKN